MKPDRSFRTLRLRGRRLRAVPAALLAGLLAVVQFDIALAADRSSSPTYTPSPRLGEPTSGRPAHPPQPEGPAQDKPGGGRTPPEDDEPTPADPRQPPVVVPRRPRPTVGLSFQISIGPRSSALAERLAREVALVKQRFGRNRRELPFVQSPGGGRAYPRQEVDGLIALTEKDLDQAIERVGEPGLEALRSWSVEELRRIQQELAAPPSHVAALSPDFSTPRAVAVVASLGWLPLAELASVNAGAPQQETITAEKGNRLLDQVGNVIGRIFFLAAHDDLEVKLWVGSTPETHATFRFWSRGQIRGSAPAPLIIRTDGQRDRVLRGLYSYRAAWAKGPVTEVVEYPNPAGVSADSTASERLDLVNGSSFFCCRFNEQYCHHVAAEKECRP